MTSVSKPYPSRIQVYLGERTGWVVLDQIRTIDRQRIGTVLGEVSPQEIAEIKQVIKELYVD